MQEGLGKLSPKKDESGRGSPLKSSTKEFYALKNGVIKRDSRPAALRHLEFLKSHKGNMVGASINLTSDKAD